MCDLKKNCFYYFGQLIGSKCTLKFIEVNFIHFGNITACIVICQYFGGNAEPCLIAKLRS